MNHTMTRTIDANKSRELADLARKLPRVIKRDSSGKAITDHVMYVEGERLLRAGITSHYGKTVTATGRYRMRTPAYENHHVNLIYNFQAGGDAQVAKYRKMMVRRAWEDLPAKKKIAVLAWTLWDLIRMKNPARGRRVDE